MKRGEEDVHVAESSPVHLSAMLPIVMQLQTTVTELKAEVTALQQHEAEQKAKITALQQHKAEQKAEVTALKSTMVTMVKYEY